MVLWLLLLQSFPSIALISRCIPGFQLTVGRGSRYVSSFLCFTFTNGTFRRLCSMNHLYA